ncbi:2-oxoglutarate dehydrogenase complex dihydrolipoyllysine-residue succinyltransferase [Anaerolineae bacterium CFX9]|nr:2-oxoglutarate dehydrogenase complex dihydrolipoyllysine-residue succinyltransferase [Kamptonema cortianum]MDL1901437.1 2-oxoglutarate dehydrogenase complex dihydrolipoyllysine-residue succinyltransferase [Anaerolineae bacterium CFX9]
MAFEITVPDLGESVVEATIARWLKQEGDTVRVGEAVVVLETDKVDLEVGAERDGVLAKISRPEGADVKVGDVIGVIDESAAASSTPSAPQEEAAQSEPSPARSNPTPTPELVRSGDASVTPVARRMAESAGVSVTEIAPTGQSGKVTKTDVQRYLETRTAPAVPASSRPSDTSGRREERVKMSRRRRTIAARLVEAQHTAAMLTTFNEIDMSRVIEIRERRRESFKQKHGVGLGFSSFFVKASIGALKMFPQLNAEIQGDDMVLKYYYDIGVAIGAEEGLVVPVLRDADRMSFAAIEQAIKEFAQQAQDGTLSLDALRGGTFTITNGGVFGSLMSTPILNPPQVAILGLHKIEQRPIALNGEVVIRPMMYVALSYDHRIVDGREAVQFLVRIKELIEDPETLLIEG